MGLEGDNRFTWIIKHFNSYLPNIISSEEFVADGCKWRLVAYPRGNNSDHFSLYLDVASSDSLPTGWRRFAAVQLTIVNQLDETLSCTKETHTWFDSKASNWGFTSMFPLEKIHEKDGGFLVNDELKIVAVVDILEVYGKLDVANELSGEANNSSNDMLADPYPAVESLDVNSFQLFPSQVEYVRRIFEKHPEIASEFHTQSQQLRSAYMSVLLGLIETLCKPTQELSRDDLADANSALGYLRDTGLNLEWLEDTLKEVTEKKENEEAGEARMKEIEEEMKELKLKYSNLEAELEEEKANVAVARAPLSFDDVV